MRYTLITPTVLRDTLEKTCLSVNEQTFGDWQHIVVIDGVEGKLPESCIHHQRYVIRCDRAHRNGGNSCRHEAWTLASGDYVYYLDDDNFLAYPNALDSMNVVTAPWALVPILRHGNRFYSDPPQHCNVDTGNVIVRREYAQWPDTMEYASDWIYIDGLMQKGLEYQRFPDLAPVMSMPKSNNAFWWKEGEQPCI